MPSPFPGVDPFIEDQANWRDFHARFLVYCSELLAETLPEEYVAQIDERFYLVEAPEGPGRQYVPDVSITREGSFPARPAARVGAATLEPVTMIHKEVATEEVRERWLEIRRQPDWEVITAIELLSPTHKSAAGQGKYSEKRLDLMERSVHLVEIDLLLGGLRLPMARQYPPGDFFALVTRAERRPECDTYAWTVRQALPSLPIPLKAPDLDALLDLAAAFALTYDRGRYSRRLRYGTPLGLPMGAEDRAWAEGLAEASARPR